MARGQRTYAYQSIPDVGPYGTATNRAAPGPDTGPAIGSLFNSGFIPSVNPTIPAYSAPAAPEPAVTQSSLETCMLSGMSREACEQREAIAQAIAEQNQGSGPGTDPGPPDAVTPTTPDVAPPVAVPEDPAPPPVTTPPPVETPPPPPVETPPPPPVETPLTDPNQKNALDEEADKADPPAP